ncbi:sigma factor regulator FecR [Petrotoga mexicana DSM 14811]|uniref:Sigma factor regulator FecR n=1 Tax=Petrotoga mexicana DSM 14811 TaxID=1122954 RepID=A0A2K1P670_9BACT|nr:SIS domain-containing protein [Petrotoga mexicana]PNR98272.1 sigma factor regulator FecR [Petrotoga mexicana DSM 14811]
MFTVEKEIKEQTKSIESTYIATKRFVEERGLPSFLFESDIVYFIGCGTSFYVAIFLSKYFTLKTGIESKALPGGEIHGAFEENIGRHYLKRAGVLISRSGDSTDTVLACRKFKENNLKTLGITLNKDSSLSEVSDETLILPINEEGIVMTKSFTSIILSFQMLVDINLNEDISKYAKVFGKIDEIIKVFENEITKINLIRFKHFVFLGLGMYEGLAREASLKLEEMSLSFTEAFSSYEYRHGPKSLADDKTLVCIFGEDEENNQTLEKELRDLGSTVINLGKLFKKTNIPSKNVAFLQILFAQILGLRIAKNKGINVDRPRNLDKVVKF